MRNLLTFAVTWVARAHIFLEKHEKWGEFHDKVLMRYN